MGRKPEQSQSVCRWETFYNILLPTTPPRRLLIRTFILGRRRNASNTRWLFIQGSQNSPTENKQQTSEKGCCHLPSISMSLRISVREFTRFIINLVFINKRVKKLSELNELLFFLEAKSTVWCSTKKVGCWKKFSSAFVPASSYTNSFGFSVLPPTQPLLAAIFTLKAFTWKRTSGSESINYLLIEKVRLRAVDCMSTVWQEQSMWKSCF